MMETVDDYADRVERRRMASLKLAIHRMSTSGSMMERSAAADLQDILDYADFDPLLEPSMAREGLGVRVDPSDGLRYVTSEVAA